MKTPSNHSEHPEAGSSSGLESSKRAAGDQGSARTESSGTRLKALLAAGVVIGVGLAVYFIAISPRIENSKQLAVAAAAAGQKAVIIVLPTQTSSAPEITLPGNIEANQMTSIYSRVDGYLKRWYVDIGDQVQEGQVLADIESPTVDASLRQAQAELELAEANLRLAQTNSARSEQLFQNKVNSQQELDTVLANEQVQKATRDNAAAALTSAQDMKGFEQIRAPFAGNITARYVDVGSLVTAGSGRTVQKLFDLAQSNPVRVFVNVPQANISSVKPGTPATITVDEYPSQVFAGKIVRDAKAFDLTSRTLLLEIEAPNPDGRLYSGMYAHAKFALQNPTRALLLPDSAIQIDSNGVRVFVVDSNGKIQVKPVELGRDFGTKSEIVSGVTVGDKVVRNPTQDLRVGMTVTVQPADN
jgi:membrane fusion protein (multidrug efflux system)